MIIEKIYSDIRENGYFYDWRGNKVAVGTRIVYPVAEKNHAYIKEGIVLEFVSDGKGYRVKVDPVGSSCGWANQNITYIRKLRNVTAVPNE